jgi:hypothetical protein
LVRSGFFIVSAAWQDPNQQATSAGNITVR